MAADFICAFFSFGISTVSIVVLYYVQPMGARLALVSVFNPVFALTMMFVVGHRRGETFAATAAFAAVQVIFVGGVNVIEQK